jgi:hypothetical protein
METPFPPTALSRQVFLKAVASQAVLAMADAPVLQAAEPTRKSNGIQMGAVSFVDEGTEKVLDLLQERGAIDTIYLTTFTYGRGLAGRQIPGHPFPDHGVQDSDEDDFNDAVHAVMICRLVLGPHTRSTYRPIVKLWRLCTERRPSDRQQSMYDHVSPDQQRLDGGSLSGHERLDGGSLGGHAFPAQKGMRSRLENDWKLPKANKGLQQIGHTFQAIELYRERVAQLTQGDHWNWPSLWRWNSHGPMKMSSKAVVALLPCTLLARRVRRLLKL